MGPYRISESQSANPSRTTSTGSYSKVWKIYLGKPLFIRQSGGRTRCVPSESVLNAPPDIQTGFERLRRVCRNYRCRIIKGSPLSPYTTSASRAICRICPLSMTIHCRPVYQLLPQSCRRQWTAAVSRWCAASWFQTTSRQEGWCACSPIFPFPVLRPTT